MQALNQQLQRYEREQSQGHPAPEPKLETKPAEHEPKRLSPEPTLRESILSAMTGGGNQEPTITSIEQQLSVSLNSRLTAREQEQPKQLSSRNSIELETQQLKPKQVQQALSQLSQQHDRQPAQGHHPEPRFDTKHTFEGASRTA